jgi:hypothetical protein
MIGDTAIAVLEDQTAGDEASSPLVVFRTTLLVVQRNIHNPPIPRAIQKYMLDHGNHVPLQLRVVSRHTQKCTPGRHLRIATGCKPLSS